VKSADYQKWAITKNRTDYVGAVQRQEAGLNDALHAAFGIAGEAGEIVDAIKKPWLYGKPVDVENVKEELGDLCWYMNLLLCATGLTWDDVMQHNHDKLEKRYPSGFSEKAAQDRADKVIPLSPEESRRLEEAKSRLNNNPKSEQ
jgi:NTP pyrophosphatase (non-canonical NTP hydrolase)